jgi:hypothetical protein
MKARHETFKAISDDNFASAIKQRDEWRARAEELEARCAVLDGSSCAEERAAGSGGCGMCAWCCKQSRDRTETAEAKVAAAEERAERLRLSEMETMKRASALEKGRNEWLAAQTVEVVARMVAAESRASRLEAALRLAKLELSWANEQMWGSSPQHWLLTMVALKIARCNYDTFNADHDEARAALKEEP